MNEKLVSPIDEEFEATCHKLYHASAPEEIEALQLKLRNMLLQNLASESTCLFLFSYLSPLIHYPKTRSFSLNLVKSVIPILTQNQKSEVIVGILEPWTDEPVYDEDIIEIFNFLNDPKTIWIVSDIFDKNPTDFYKMLIRYQLIMDKKYK